MLLLTDGAVCHAESALCAVLDRRGLGPWP